MRVILYTWLDHAYHILINWMFYTTYYRYIQNNFPWMTSRVPRFQFVRPLHRDYITISYFRDIAQMCTLLYSIPYIILHWCGEAQYRETRKNVYLQNMTTHALVISYMYTKALSPYRVLVKRLAPHCTFILDMLMYVYTSVLNYMKITSRILVWYYTLYFFQAAHRSKNWLINALGRTRYWLRCITHTKVLAVVWLIEYGMYIYLLVQAMDGTGFWIELMALVQIYCRDRSTRNSSSICNDP